jgi:hypothetical protein
MNQVGWIPAFFVGSPASILLMCVLFNLGATPLVSAAIGYAVGTIAARAMLRRM